MKTPNKGRFLTRHSTTKNRTPKSPRSRWSTGRVAAVAVAMAVLFTQLAGRAAPKPPPTSAVSLPFSEEFTVRGNVVVGTVDVVPTGSSGFTEGIIHIN